jgi:hypothetical protein
MEKELSRFMETKEMNKGKSSASAVSSSSKAENEVSHPSPTCCIEQRVQIYFSESRQALGAQSPWIDPLAFRFFVPNYCFSVFELECSPWDFASWEPSCEMVGDSFGHPPNPGVLVQRNDLVSDDSGPYFGGC